MAYDDCVLKGVLNLFLVVKQCHLVLSMANKIMSLIHNRDSKMLCKTSGIIQTPAGICVILSEPVEGGKS